MSFLSMWKCTWKEELKILVWLKKVQWEDPECADFYDFFYPVIYYLISLIK